MGYSGAWEKLIHEKPWSQKSHGTVPLNFLLHIQNCTLWKPQISWNSSFKLPFAYIKLHIVKATDSHRHSLPIVNYPISHDCETTLSPPPHTLRKESKIASVTSVYFKSGGGRFHAQCCGNVLLWPKSDDSKKSLVLFYLFTLWVTPFCPVCAEHFENLIYLRNWAT